MVWLCIHSTAPAPRCCRCGGWTGRGTLCLRLPAAWPCPAPLTDTRCTHVRAGLLLLLAVVRPTTGSLLPSPPAACSVSTRGAPRVTTDNWVGGWWEKFHWLDVATVSAALAVVTLAWGCAAPNRSSEVCDRTGRRVIPGGRLSPLAPCQQPSSLSLSCRSTPEMSNPSVSGMGFWRPATQAPARASGRWSR